MVIKICTLTVLVHCENTELGLYLMTECSAIRFLFKYGVVFKQKCMQKIKASRNERKGLLWSMCLDVLSHSELVAYKPTPRTGTEEIHLTIRTIILASVEANSESLIENLKIKGGVRMTHLIQLNFY